MRNRNLVTLEYVLLFLVAVVPFVPSVFFDVTNWDDNVYVTDNPLIRISTVDTWKAILTESYANFYHPFTLLSLKLDHFVFRGTSWGFHAVNVLLHGLNVVVFLSLCRRWVNSKRAAVWITLLFALHPLRAEVVYWITERKELLCTAFSLLALRSYQPASNRGAFPFASFFFFLCALLSKSMAVSLPLLLLLVDGCTPPGRISVRAWVEKIPFFLASLAFVVLTYGAQQKGGATVAANEQPWLWNVLSMAYSCGFYILKTIVPVGLSPLYSLNRYAPESQGVILCCLFPVCLLLGAILWVRRGDRLILFGLVFYFITLLPVSGIIRFGPVLVADRFSYFPALGLSLSLGWAVFLFWEWRLKAFQRVGRVLAVLFLAALAFLAARQGRVWKDSFHLWTSVLTSDPACGTAWANLCSACVRQGKPEQAEAFCSRALELNPGDYRARLNRGLAALLRGHRERASEEFHRAGRMAPEDPLVIYSEGLLKAQEGDFAGASRCFEQVRARSPFHKEATGMLGVLLFRQGEVSRAMEYLENAVAWGCRDEGVYKALLDAYFAEKKWREAVSLCRRWLPWAADKKAIQRRICLLKLWQGYTEEARDCFQDLDG